MKALWVWLLLVVTGWATPVDPGATAVKFLEKIRSKQLDLAPGADTALAPETSANKRREIARRLERMANDLGDASLEVGPVKLDGELAAVLVRKNGGFDPRDLKVFPVALVKRGAAWIAAPVPGSFENAGVGYAAVLRQRVAGLEEWMLREQAADLEQLHVLSADRLRQQIARTLPVETMRAFSASQAAHRFLSACQQRNLPEMLGLLGGLSNSQPDDWPQRLKAVENALAAKTAVKRPWRELLAGEVLRVLLPQDEYGDTATVPIFCLDPAGPPRRAALPRAELVQLEMVKTTDGLWRIDLPNRFFEPEPTADAPDENPTSDVLEQIVRKLGDQHRATPQASPERCAQALLDALRTPSPAAALRLIDLGGAPEAAMQAAAGAAQLWWTVRGPNDGRYPLPLAMQTERTQAAAIYQLFSARNPDRFEPLVLFFHKSGDGWLWTPAPDSEVAAGFRDWRIAQVRRGQDAWPDLLLEDCVRLTELPAGEPPAAEASQRVVAAWLEALGADDVRAALRLTARFDSGDSREALLRNLGYHLTGVVRDGERPVLAEPRQRGPWTAIGIGKNPGNPPSWWLYPVVATAAGPRILLEVDLLASGTRGRDFLNKTAIKRLRQNNAAAADDLGSLFAEYQAQVVKTATP